MKAQTDWHIFSPRCYQGLLMQGTTGNYAVFPMDVNGFSLLSHNELRLVFQNLEEFKFSLENLPSVRSLQGWKFIQAERLEDAWLIRNEQGHLLGAMRWDGRWCASVGGTTHRYRRRYECIAMIMAFPAKEEIAC